MRHTGLYRMFPRYRQVSLLPSTMGKPTQGAASPRERVLASAWVAARMFGPDNPGVYVADAAEALIAAHATDARARLLH